MTEDVPFLKKGERLPVDEIGPDEEGESVPIDELVRGHDRTLLYFYPFDARSDVPEAWRRLESEADLRARRLGVVGVSGPPEAVRDAPIARLRFPLVEDYNYRIGQAVGIMGGGRGDDIGREPPRGLVVLDGEGRVVDARRGDSPEVLDEVLKGL